MRSDRMIERLQIRLLRLLPSPVLRLFEGFWAVPLVLASAGVFLAASIQFVPETAIGPEWVRLLESIDVDGTKSALSMIAGGMVSLITLVFSLTFVALSITAQQLSPRILDFVLRDRSAQVLLGLALTTLLYAAITLSLGDVRGVWRLGMAMPLALLLAAANLMIVVIFAHRMTRVMRTHELVAQLGDEFISDMKLLVEPPAGCVACETPPERQFEDAEAVTTRRAGYVGLVDYAELATLAREHDLRISLEVRESDFLLPGVVIARVIGELPDLDKVTKTIGRALNLTDRREATDTARYEADALGEAALRALSPGINDPATAISCLNRIYEGLAELAAGDGVPLWLDAEEDGGDGKQGAAPEGRVRRQPLGVPQFLDRAVWPVIGSARGSAQTLDRIMALNKQLHRIAERQCDRDAIEALDEAVAAARGELDQRIRSPDQAKSVSD